MRGDGRHIVRLAFDDRSRADAAGKFARDSVSVALRENAAVDKHPAFHRREVATFFDHLFQEENGTFG
ncbi:hypothetical protein SDC9_73169 [bioreactor metagenome]|uniref:Uncharacterized protein n=1 Tax=bioreactor metagenome TaxID=1076179 RepID=A0A644YDQ0_9ZZZZ